MNESVNFYNRSLEVKIQSIEHTFKTECSNKILIPSFFGNFEQILITIYRICVQFAISIWLNLLFALTDNPYVSWGRRGIFQSCFGVVSSSSSPIHINESMNLPTLCGCSKLGWWFASFYASVLLLELFSSSGDWSSLVFTESYTSSWFSISLFDFVAGTVVGKMSSIGYCSSFGGYPGTMRWFLTRYL